MDSKSIGDNKLTIALPVLRETIDKYTQSPLIRQSLLDGIKNRQENGLKTLTDVQPSNFVNGSTKIKIISDSGGWCEFCCETRASKKIEIGNEIRYICSKCLADTYRIDINGRKT